MIGKTNGVSIANATKDATATADSLLYGHTAYGADGTKLTGTGAYWQHVTEMVHTFISSTTLTGAHEFTLPPLCTIYDSPFTNCDLLTSLTVTFGTPKSMTYFANNCSILATVILNGNTASVTSFVNMFNNSPFLATVGGSPLNLTAATGAGVLSFMFGSCPALANVAFVASTIKQALSFSGSPSLSTASLLSIANGLSAANVNTLTMHETAKTNMDNISVDVTDGVATLGTTKTLTQFITIDKGWTIA